MEGSEEAMAGSEQESGGADVGKVGNLTRVPKTNAYKLAESYCSHRTNKYE